jgi:hypothetical protein
MSRLLTILFPSAPHGAAAQSPGQRERGQDGDDPLARWSRAMDEAVMASTYSDEARHCLDALYRLQR